MSESVDFLSLLYMYVSVFLVMLVLVCVCVCLCHGVDVCAWVRVRLCFPPSVQLKDFLSFLDMDTSVFLVLLVCLCVFFGVTVRVCVWILVCLCPYLKVLFWFVFLSMSYSCLPLFLLDTGSLIVYVHICSCF